MKRLRLSLSILICKILILMGKLLGKKGSSAPGKFALKICPDAMRMLSKNVSYEIICVLGTNGKTTTNNMIASLLEQNKFKIICNRVGANMLDGVATAFISATNLAGTKKADYAVLEIDEASAKLVFDHITPDVIVVTNLFRDQMDRYGEIEQTLAQLKLAIDKAPEAMLCLNADDPMSSYFTKATENRTVTFGISQPVAKPLSETKEGRNCPLCSHPLTYQFYHYNQLGNYACSHCDFVRPTPDYYAEDIVCEPKIRFRLNGTQLIETDIFGFYNIYNMLAAITVYELLEPGTQNYTELYSSYTPQTARMESFHFRKPVILNLAKNPAGFNQAISTILSDPRKKAVVIGINDMPSDGCDISWLYDVDFEALKDCSAYGAAGKRCYDMALRLYYADVCESPKIDKNPVPMALEFLQTDCQVVYVLVNYTLIFQAKDDLQKAEKAFLKSNKKQKKGETSCN